MKLATICQCIYPDTRPIHYLAESCLRQGINLLPHGIGAPFAGWSQAMISHTLPAMQDLKARGYTHVLYTDGRDSIIIASEEEILRKYREQGSPPCLMSADSECFPPHPDAAGRFLGPMPWRFVNAGGFIGEIDYIVGTTRRLAEKYPDDHNNQSWIVRDWPIDGLLLDHFCEIFQPMDDSDDICTYSNRVLNKCTMTQPCVLHFRGGYCDPEVGRDFRIAPVWRQLYETRIERGVGATPL